MTAVGKFANVTMLPPAMIQRIERAEHVERGVIKLAEDESERALDIDLIFVEIGFRPATGLISHLTELNDRGEVIVDRENQIDSPG